MVSELMNMGDEPGEVVVAITYEYIPSPDASFAHVQPVWLDIGPGGGCEGAERPAFANSTFNYSSPAWTAKTDGRVVFTASHLHNGGSHLDIQLNGEVMCSGVAAYGQTPAYIETMPMNMSMNGMMMEMNMTMKDISSISTCSNRGALKADDELSITAFYDTNKYMPMRNTDGSLEPIMGIALVYFVEGSYVNATNGTHIMTSGSTAASPEPQPSTGDGARLGVAGTISVWCVVLAGVLALM